VRTTHNGISGIGVYPPLAGNDGRGAWYAASPGAGKDVIAVGSVDKFVTGPSPWDLTKHQINSPAVEGTETGGIMSGFSSLGPTYELDFKPEFSAPGGGIFSTLPRNTFGTFSGTQYAG
jgi:hypothetical protein